MSASAFYLPQEGTNLQHHIIMGNRAAIKTAKNDLGIYLHWNGGRDSIEALLATCDIQGYVSPERDGYGWAYLCGVCALLFGMKGDSLGIYRGEQLDGAWYDNGVYIIENWHIVGREHAPEVEQHEYDLLDFVNHLDGLMPEGRRLGEEEVKKRLIEKGWIKE